MTSQHPDRATARRGVLFALQPLARRIPLLTTLVLVLTIGTMLWLGYHLVYDSVVTAELSRLQTASRQVATTLQGQIHRLQGENVRIAARPELSRAASPLATSGDQTAARRTLAAESAKSTAIRAMALWSPTGKLILTSGVLRAAERNPPRVLEGQSTPSPDGADIGPLDAVGDTVDYATVSPIKGPVGETVGYLAVTRRIASNANQSALLGGLVGKGATVLLGNVAGDFWTNFDAPVAAPTLAPKSEDVGAFQDQRGVEQLYALTAVPETPWNVMVTIRREEAVLAAREFVWKMLALAAAFIVGGAILTWVVIARSLHPLGEVAEAAEGLADGDYSRRVPVRGDDELGRLGATFNAMAEEVQHAATEIAARAEMLEASNQELQQSEQRYRELIEHSPNGIVVHRDRNIIFANTAAAQLLGATEPAELVGHSVLEFVDPADRSRIDERAARVEDRGTPAPTVELRHTRADKKQVTFEVMSMPLVVDGHPAVQTIMRDITQQRALEEQLRQSQKMDAVGRLAGGIAHDFNNLLTVIQAHAEFALGEDSPEARRADIEEIRRASDSAARLTRQLLTFSRKQVIVPSHIDLNAAIAGMLGMLSRLIGGDIEVVTVAGENLAGVWADPGQLEQVLLNLAINARDAMPDGGMLRFETANVSIGEGYDEVSGNGIPAGDYVMLAVQDTGVGMSEDVRAHVFEPFFTTKQPGRGTGLGLSTVYGIVRQSGGHIWVYSEVERGTTFKIFFPPHRRDDDAAITDTGEFRVAPQAATILLVEDEPSVRNAIRRALTHARYTVIEAADGASAMDILTGGEPVDLVITDMVMPKKSGAELVADIARIRPGIPVVIMSGYSEDTASRQWHVPENAAFLEKPVSPKKLTALIAQLLRSKPLAS